MAGNFGISRMTDSLYDVVGIGNALVDVFARVGDGFLTERGLPKGNMLLMEAVDAGKIYQDIIPEREVSGGAAGNTMAAIASLGGHPAFIGKVHDDEMGQLFRRDIGASGVEFFTSPLTQGQMTGRCIVLVTPDAKRSMFTFLGAAQGISKKDIDEEMIKAAKIVYLEGYMWDTKTAKQAILKACFYARRHKKQIAFSLSDKFCVERHRNEFRALIKKYVDVLFANEEEFMALYKANDFYETLDLVKEDVEIAAITRSDKGSVVVNGKTKVFVDAELVEDVVDTTGAGDIYAAGFLFAYTHGRSLITCAQVGGIAASETITHYGGRPEVSLRGYVRQKIADYGKSI